MQANLQHAAEEVLERYSLGRLSEAETEIVEEHLFICPACQDRLTEMDTYVRTMQEALRKPQGRHSWSWFDFSHRFFGVPAMPGLAWAVGAALCVVLLFWVSGIRKLPISAGSSPVAVSLQAMRGAEQAGAVKAPKGRPLALEADVSGLPLDRGCVLQVVDERGNPVWQGQAKPDGTKLTLQVPNGLNQGRYWVRLYAATSARELLREYALLVQ